MFACSVCSYVASVSVSEQVWKNYRCEVSSAGICTTTGRLTPDIYNQTTAAVNVSYGLYRYGPFLVGLQDCTFVRQTFSGISVDHCPGLRKYTEWIYVGLVMVSAAVMLSLIFWVIYARERRHRVYMKQFITRPPQDREKGPWEAVNLLPNLFGVIKMTVASIYWLHFEW